MTNQVQVFVFVVALFGVSTLGVSVAGSYFDKILEEDSANFQLAEYTMQLRAQTRNETCRNSTYVCESGYFCLFENTCLKGDPHMYAPGSLWLAGVVAALYEDDPDPRAHKLECLEVLDPSLKKLGKSFYHWSIRKYDTAIKFLRAFLRDTSQGIGFCEKEYWHEVISSMLLYTAKNFKPDGDIYFNHLYFHGFYVYELYERMFLLCSDSYADYARCGRAASMFAQAIVAIENGDTPPEPKPTDKATKDYEQQPVMDPDKAQQTLTRQGETLE